MKKKSTICVLGNGRIARAVFHYLKPFYKVKIFDSVKHDPLFESCDLFIGALAGGIGEECLKLALYYKKHWWISPMLTRRSISRCEKDRRGGNYGYTRCGFSPGLVNCVLGKELKEHNEIESIEIKAGH